MRILTPIEQREVEKVKDMIVKGHGETEDNWIDDMHGDVLNIDLVSKSNRELWLNILDLALQANDAMKEAWRRTGNPQQGELEQAIATKLRANE